MQEIRPLPESYKLYCERCQTAYREECCPVCGRRKGRPARPEDICLLTETDGLRRIDRYFQEQLRFLATGRHNKKNFSVRYGTLKSLGYRSLVHEFYAPLSGRPGFGRLPEL